jgi:hypothetical protein
MDCHASLTLAIALLFTALVPASVRGDAPPPSQALESDAGPPFARIALSADAGAIAFADYALRFDVAPERWIAPFGAIGLSRRHGGDALLIELGLALWLLGGGLEGPWIAPALGISIAGPWNGNSAGARSVLRWGGDVGWQFLWGDLAIALGAGALGLTALDGSWAVWIEPRVRVAIGVVWR